MIQSLMIMALAATASPVEQKLICIEALDHGPEHKAELIVMWTRSRRARIESLDVYSDGSIGMRIQLRHDAGLKSCRAKITKERLAAFEAELRRSAVCSVRPPKPFVSEESDGIDLDLGVKHRCHFNLSPSAWARAPATRAAQQAIDRLRSDICEGPCADPKPPRERFQLVEDATRVSPAFRHLYKKPADPAPDAAPPTKP